MSDYGKPIAPIITGRPDYPVRNSTKNVPASGIPFGDLLKKSIEQRNAKPLTFSRHAQARTEQRNIALTQSDMDRLTQAVSKAEDKGLTDTLVFMNNTAFIVNVPSKVVITVVDGSESENNVFTNIDGAVIV